MQWDLDSAFPSYKKTGASIYNQRKGGKYDVYEEALVESPSAPFRTEYQEVMHALLDGPFVVDDLLSGLAVIEAEIGAALDADPNNGFGMDTAAEQFDLMRGFISERIANVLSELP